MEQKLVDLCAESLWYSGRYLPDWYPGMMNNAQYWELYRDSSFQTIDYFFSTPDFSDYAAIIPGIWDKQFRGIRDGLSIYHQAGYVCAYSQQPTQFICSDRIDRICREPRFIDKQETIRTMYESVQKDRRNIRVGWIAAEGLINQPGEDYLIYLIYYGRSVSGQIVLDTLQGDIDQGNRIMLYRQGFRGTRIGLNIGKYSFSESDLVTKFLRR